jgi:hypothetical protein
LCFAHLSKRSKGNCGWELLKHSVVFGRRFLRGSPRERRLRLALAASFWPGTLTTYKCQLSVPPFSLPLSKDSVQTPLPSEICTISATVDDVFGCWRMFTAEFARLVSVQAVN